MFHKSLPNPAFKGDAAKVRRPLNFTLRRYTAQGFSERPLAYDIDQGLHRLWR